MADDLRCFSRLLKFVTMRLPCRLRRRLVLILIVFTTLGLLFLSFQMFSVHLLSQENRSNGNYLSGRRALASRRRKAVANADNDFDLEEHSHRRNQYLEKYFEQLQQHGGNLEPPSSDIHEAWGPWPILQLMGVPPHRLKIYQTSLESGSFACLSQPEQRIPISQVNDDYCDCPLDGSDEPGTAACASGNNVLPSVFKTEEISIPRFFCQFQLPGTIQTITDNVGPNVDYYDERLSSVPLQWTLHSRVNDGICDCCDGSDEWRFGLAEISNNTKNAQKKLGRPHSLSKHLH